MNSPKTVTLWQLVLLVTALLGASAGGYGLYVLFSGSGQSGLSDDLQLIPIEYGSLVNDVSTNGSIVFPNKEGLRFDIQGTIGEILVDEGQQVEQGQPLARMDALTVSYLDKALAEARISLRSAEEALGEAKNPHKPQDVAQSEASVADARLSLKNVQDSMDKLLNPTDQAIAEAEASVANAKVAHQNAQDYLVRLLSPMAKDVAQARTAVTDAKISVKNAQEALDLVRAGPSAGDVATTEAQIDSSTTTLANDVSDLRLTRRDWVANLQTAQQYSDNAWEAYRDVLGKWLGLELVSGEDAVDPVSLLDSRDIDLERLFDMNLRFQDINRGRAADGPPGDDPITPWNERTIYIWLNFFPGQIAPTCSNDLVPPMGVCIKKEIDTAWDVYQEATADLDTLQTQAAKAIAKAETNVTKAEDNLTSAQENLADMLAGPDALKIESKANQLKSAQIALDAAQEDLEALLGDPAPVELQDKEKQLAVAKASLDKAEEDAAELMGTPNGLEVEAKEKKIAVAQANLYKAQEDLEELMGGIDSLELSLREANLVTNQLTLATALERLQRTTIKAPIAGVISMVNVEVGQIVNPDTMIVEVVDTTIVEMDGIVDEIDVLLVKIDARADVTMDALPGRVLEGKVFSIDSAARNQQGVVSYPIRIQVIVPEGLQLIEGLSATANIILREESHVLLVPVQALYGSFEHPTVRVMDDGHILEKAVVLGNSDDFWITVREGLAEGDHVIVEAAQASTSQFLFRGFGGGGFRGGSQGQQHGRN